MDEQGQASVEWVGVVALVAVLFVTALALAFPGTGIAGAFIRQFERALCIVSGGVCDLDQRPCPVASSATKDDAHVNLVLFRVGDDELILYEKQSDGSVLVTYLRDVSAGIDVGVGFDGSISVKGESLSASASARAALLAAIGGGETWRFADPYAADAGMAALSEGHDPARGERVEVVDDREVARAELDAKASVEEQASAGLHLDGRLVYSVSHDPRDGSRTYVVSAGVGASAVLKADGASAAGAGNAEERIAVRMAPDGSPRELTITRTGKLQGVYSLPDAVQGVAAQLTGGSSGSRTWVVESHLDLTDPTNREVAGAFFDAISRSPTDAVSQADALRRRIDAAGVIETRTYDLATRDNGSLSVHVAAGGKVGLGLGEQVEDLSLVDARVRSADGVWRTRDDCLGTA